MQLFSFVLTMAVVGVASGLPCSIPSAFNAAVANKIRMIGKARKIDDRVMLALFETAWVESHVNNLSCGDKDSLGVFQQRPSQGWCTPASLCLDITHATNSFLSKAIKVGASKPGLTAGQLAQVVQGSEFPDRYDESESIARSIIAGVGGF